MKRLVKSRPSMSLLRTLVLLPLLAGCVVPQSRLEEAESAIHVEQEAHRRTLGTLSRVSQELDRAQELLRQREVALEGREQELSAAAFANDVAAHQKTEASDLVEQLRGELGRIGEHLRAYADEKQRLGQALEAAEARSERLAQAEQTVTERAAVVRDLSVALAGSLSTGALELEVSEGRVLLLLPRDELGEKPGAVAKSTLTAIAGVVRHRPLLNVQVESDDASDAPQLARVAAELASRSVPSERVRVNTSPTEASGADGMIVVALTL